MVFQSKAVAGLCICFSIIILIVMIRSKRFFSSLFLSALSGCAALFGLNLMSEFLGFSLSLNPVTLAISCVGGIPGVVMLLVSRLFLV